MVRTCKKSGLVTEQNCELEANIFCRFYFPFARFYARFNFRCTNFESFSWRVCLRARVRLKTLSSLLNIGARVPVPGHQVWTESNGPLDLPILQVYVNGALRGSARGSGPLDDFWGYKACLGSFDLGGRYLRGFVDDFYIFNYAIQPDQIKDLLRIKCPGKSRR